MADRLWKLPSLAGPHQQARHRRGNWYHDGNVRPAMIEQLTPEYWRAKARDVRAQAIELHDPDDRNSILQLARMYEGVAQRMEERLAEMRRAAA